MTALTSYLNLTAHPSPPLRLPLLRKVRDLQTIGQRALSIVAGKDEQGNEQRFGFHVSVRDSKKG
jgi:hypothetical protein